MKIIFIITGVILICFLALTLFLQQTLPGKVKEAQARRSELSRINQLVEAQDQLNQFQKQRDTLVKNLPELETTINDLMSMAAKENVALAFSQPDTQLSKSALHEWHISALASANSAAPIKTFLTNVMSVKRVYLKSSNTSIRPEQPVITNLQFIIYAK